MWKGWGKSLRSRIFFSVIIFVLFPVIIVMALIWENTLRILEERQTVVYDENTRYLARLCENVFENIKSKSLLVYSDGKTMDILNKGKGVNQEEQKILNGKVSGIFYSDDDIDSIAFYADRLQVMIYKKRNESDRFYRIEDPQEVEKYFKYQLDSEELRYSVNTIPDEKQDGFQIVLNQNIVNQNNELMVRMEIVYNQSVFDPVFYGNERDEYSGNFILDQNNQFIYEEFGGRFPEGMAQIMKQAPEGITRTEGKEPYIIFRVPLNKLSYDVVKCVSLDAISEHMMPYRHSLVIVFCLITVIIAMLAFILSRLVREPIRKFTQLIVSFRNSGNYVEPEIKAEIEEMEDLAGEFLTMMREINQLIDEKSEARYREKEAYLKMLTVQINPHFLYNALQTLQFMALKRKAFEINAMLTALGKILRYSLNWEEGEVTLKEELENALEYLNIQKFRYVEKLKLEVEQAEEIPECRIPKMILQPLIENCFVHGFQDRTEDFRIRMEIRSENKAIVIRIMDNGKGMEQEEITRFNRELAQAENYAVPGHSGMLGLNFRLRQKYRGASVRIEQEDWFCVIIRIPEVADENIDH